MTAVAAESECVVCHEPKPTASLSSLGRCWDCIVGPKGRPEPATEPAAGSGESFYDLWDNRRGYIERIRGAQPAVSVAPASSKRATPKRVAALLRTVASAHNGQRNATLYWAAMRMAEYDMDHAKAAHELLDAALSTGLPEAEAGRTICSALGVNPAKAVTQ